MFVQSLYFTCEKELMETKLTVIKSRDDRQGVRMSCEFRTNQVTFLSARGNYCKKN